MKLMHDSVNEFTPGLLTGVRHSRPVHGHAVATADHRRCAPKRESRGGSGALNPTKALPTLFRVSASFIRDAAHLAVHRTRLGSPVRAPLLQPCTAPPADPLHCTAAPWLPVR